MMSMEEVNKLKVVDLRHELQIRGLDVKGVKAVLVERLLAALETGSAMPLAANGSTNATSVADTSIDEEEEGTENGSEKKANETAASPVKITVSTPTASPTKPVVETVAPPAISPSKEPAVVPAVAAVTSPVKPAVAASPVKPSAVTAVAVSPVKPTVTVPAASPIIKTTTPPVVSASPNKPTTTTTSIIPVQSAPASQTTTTTPAAVVKTETPAAAAVVKTETPAAAAVVKTETPAAAAVVKTETPAAAAVVKTEIAAVPMETEDASATTAVANKRKLDSTETEEGKKDVKKLKTEPVAPPTKVVVENEPEFDQNIVLLDWYKSDLNLKISKESFLEAEPIVTDEFPFAYGGAKATYGFTDGKIFYEVKYLKNLDVRADFGDLESKHVLRVGWSDLLTDLQLGQEKFSYGWDSKCKLWKGGEVEDATEGFVEGDVIGMYLEIGTENVEFRFTKNGTAVGEPIQVTKTEVEGKTWFPHVLVRNVKFQVNFGGSEPANAPLEGYLAVGSKELEETRVRGPQRPENKADCELIMLVGLACSGKTRWAKEYVKNNAEKNYIILGTSTVVERSVKDPSIITSGKAPKAYESFMNRAGKFVEKLVDMAPTRRRNYILDQSNVLPSVQRRKCGGFEGFKRRAVVVLPLDEEYQKRIKAKEIEQGKSVPKSTILDMKASFQLPEIGELFSEVDFPEVPKVEAAKLVATYNKEGLDAGYGRSGSGRGGGRGNGSGYHGRGRGGFMSRGGRGFMRGGPRGGRGGMMMRGPPRPPMRGGPPLRPMGGFRGRPGMGGPPPMNRGPPPPMVQNHNVGPPRDHIPPGPRGGGLRGGPPRGPPRGIARGGGPTGRGGGGGGTWQRASGSMGNGSNGNQRTPHQQSPQGRFQGHGRGGGGSGGANNAPRWSSPQNIKPLGQTARPQVWQQQPPPQQSVWAQGNPRGFNNTGFGQQQQQMQQQQQQQQPQQFVDPWVQHQQVPDQGFGRSWDSMNNSGGGNAHQTSNQRGGGSGGGTWQGYGGQQFGGFGQGGGGGRR